MIATFHDEVGEIFLAAHHLAVRGLDQEIDLEAELIEPAADVFPAVTNRLGIRNQLIALFENIVLALGVVAVHVGMLGDENGATDGERRGVPGFEERGLALVDLREGLSLRRSTKDDGSKQNGEYMLHGFPPCWRRTTSSATRNPKTQALIRPPT
jgi:hypothetical protein